MEIRLRLTLQFTLLVALLLLGVLALNYYQAFRFSLESFEARLRERAVIVASTHLDQDEIHQNQFDEIGKKYQQVLPSEFVVIYDEKNNPKYYENKEESSVSTEFLEKLKREENKMVEKNGRLYLGIFYEDQQGKFFVVASAIDRVGKEKLNNQLQTMYFSFFLFLVFIVLAGQLLAKKALAPIQSVIQQVREISAVNLHERVHYPNNTDEIAQLAQTFNLMLNRLEEAFQSQSSFVQNASHELRNPLAAMIGHVETTLVKERDVKYYEEELRIIHQETLRLSHIVNSLLQLSTASYEQVMEGLTNIRLDELLLDVIEKLSLTKNYHQIEIKWPENQDEELFVRGNRNLLEVALTNILENACKYSDEKLVTCTFQNIGQIIILTIKDRGIGIPQSDLQNIFIPFYRSPLSRQREGFGIGLAIAHKILNLHSIQIKIESEINKGTSVILTFQKSTQEE